jgi:uncharacterized protein (UPF0332 family)
MSYDFEECMEKGFLQKIKPDAALVAKELAEAQYDLESAIRSLQQQDAKWATVKAYYSMFHSARALIFSKGYREKRHACVVAAVEALFVEKNLLEPTMLENLERAMDLREEADYRASYSPISAKSAVEMAESFFARAKSILGDKK